jgi:hypothetical protein
MKITLFTVEQANRMARTIRPQLEELVRLQEEMQRIEKRLDVLPLALSGATAANPDSSEARTLESKRTELASKVRKTVEAIHGRGAIVKDLERGLVDFYALAGDRLIFLCWHLGEREVSHWHTLEGGFASRQPLHRSPLED